MRAAIPRRQGFRLGRSLAGSGAAPLLRNTAVLGQPLIACEEVRIAAMPQAVVSRARRRRRSAELSKSFTSQRLICVPPLERSTGWRVFFSSISSLGETTLAKYMTAGLVGSALLATVAFAQTPTATT